MSVEFKDQPAENRTAYPDWERETRPEHAKDRFTLTKPFGDQPPILTVEWPLFRPVYVKLRGKTAFARKLVADAVFYLADTLKLILLGDDARATLEHIQNNGGKVADHETCLFVHECEDEALSQVTEIFCERIHTGPAVPGLSLGDLRSTALQNASVDHTARSDGDAVVVTAIIDTEIGIGHERFRLPDGSTRVRHFWRQRRETYSGMSGLTIGRQFDADDIDQMLRDSKGQERTFYDLLRSGAYGEDGGERPVTSRGQPTIEDLSNSLTERARSLYAAGIEPLIMPDRGNVADRELQNLLLEGGHLIKAVSDGPPYLMSERPPGLRAGHGTWVADIAAGHPMERASNDRPIVAVELPDHAVADTAGQRLEVFVLMGLRRILNWCDNWNRTPGNRVPVVVNISLGNTAGPKDGTGFLEAEIARLVDARNAEGIATRVVMAAGNAYRDRLTARFDLANGGTETLDWRVQPDDRSPSFLEIRVPQQSTVAVTITAPDGSAQAIAPDNDYDLTMQGDLVGRIYQPTPTNGQSDRTIIVALAPTQTAVRMGRRAPQGTWKIGFQNTGEPAQVRLDVQRDDSLSGWPPYGRQSWLDHPASRNHDAETGVMDMPDGASPVVRTHTLSAHATGPSPHVLVVGGAKALDGISPDGWKPTRYTASGPTFGTRTGPDLSAVSEDGPATPGLRAAGYMSGSTAVFSGTSGAAPQVTRALVDDLLANGQNPVLVPIDPKSPHAARLGESVLFPVTLSGRHPRRRSARA